MNRWLRWGVVAVVLAWSGFWLARALHRWRMDRVADLAFGPYTTPELLPHIRQITDWRTPLWTALVPLGVLALAWGVVKVWRLQQRRAARLNSPP